jgi:hypothetical protein
MKKKLMHWWGEGMSGTAFAFIKAYLYVVTLLVSIIINIMPPVHYYYQSLYFNYHIEQ